MKKFIYTDDDLLKFLLRQIKFIDVHAEELSTDEIVSATIIYRNGGETDCRLPRKLIDYLSDRIHDLFEKDERITDDKDSFLCFDKPISVLSDRYSDTNAEKNVKKYTDIELLEKVLPMLRYSIDNYGDKDNDIVDIKILESNDSYAVNKSFVVALQNRINELAKKTRVEATNIIVDKDENIGCNNRWGDCAEQTYSSKEYYELKKECIEKDHEIFLLKRKVEALEYLIYNCIPKDDRRAG